MGRDRRRPAPPAAGPPDHDDRTGHRHRVRSRVRWPNRSPPRSATLEQDLWLSPMRDGLRAAIRLTGSMPARALDRSPIVVAVDGMAAADLVALGVDPSRRRAAAPARSAAAGPTPAGRMACRPVAQRLRRARHRRHRPCRRRPVGRARTRRARQPRARRDPAQRPPDARQPARPRGDRRAPHPELRRRIRDRCITGVVSRRPGPRRGRADGRADRARSSGAGAPRAEHRRPRRHRRAGHRRRARCLHRQGPATIPTPPPSPAKPCACACGGCKS